VESLSALGSTQGVPPAVLVCGLSREELFSRVNFSAPPGLEKQLVIPLSVSRASDNPRHIVDTEDCRFSVKRGKEK
jgi:hypothetical protein